MSGSQFLSDRAFGMEIEAVGFDPFRANGTLMALGRSIMMRCGMCAPQHEPDNRFEFWQIMKDDTVKADPPLPADAVFELASPICQGASGWQDIAQVMQAMYDNGASVNDTSALQVQIDLRDVWDNPELRLCVKKSIAKIYIIFESGIDSIIRPRQYRRRYSKPLRDYFDSDMSLQKMCDVIDVCDEKQLEILFSSPRGVAPYKPALKFREHQTAEYRAHQGVLNPDRALGWTALCQGITDAGILAAQGLLDLNPFIQAERTSTSPKESLQRLLDLIQKPQLWSLLHALEMMPRSAPVSMRPLGSRVLQGGRSVHLGFDPSRHGR